MKDNNFSPFPITRPRRLRQNASIRQMMQQVSLSPKDLIMPFFILDGEGRIEAIASMPAIERISIDLLIEKVQDCYALGIRAVALFPVTPATLKTNDGREALNPDNLICKAICALKKAVPEMLLVTDVALDPYTSHGHDGLLIKGQGREGLTTDNDATLDILAQQALLQAEAGADIIAPSDMCDGRVGRIRSLLDEKGFAYTMIMSYAAKYASHFYGPFRDAVGSSSALKSSKADYQMDFHQKEEAFKEIQMDLSEGADMIIIKPGMAYLDVMARASDHFNVPIYAYQVSGEYAMLSHGASQGFFDRKSIIRESLIAFKRAGCQGIISYFAMEYAQLFAQ